MKAEIHPQYVECTIICACGEVVHTRSTRPQIRVEICSKCHPFYTGKQKLVDTAGRWRSSRRNMAWSQPPRANVGGKQRADHVGQIRRPGTTLYRAE